MPACGFIKPSGEACKAIPMTGEAWCWVHHPEHAEKRKRLGSKGGKRGGRGRPQTELADIKARLSDLAENVLDGTVDKGKGAVVSQVLNVLLRAVSVELKVKEVTELEERLEELEASLERQNKSGRRYGT
jgi:hypothetical protein